MSNIQSSSTNQLLEVNITNIPTHQRYWLIRTLQGEYYDEFFHGNFIGIGWNDFCSIDEIKQAGDSPKQHYEAFIQKIREADPNDKQPGLSFSQLKRFMIEINKGDIVIIPNQNSRFVSFGIITSDMNLVNIKEDDALEGACPFKKRRNVHWLKTIPRDSLDPYLYRLLYSHHTITNADDYALYIDRTLHSLYMKDNRAHLVLRINTENAVRLKDLSLLMDGIIDVVQLCNLPDLDASQEDFDKLEVKINVQSPGPLEYIACASVIAIVATGVYAVNQLLKQGGEFNFDIGWRGVKLNFKTEGSVTTSDKLLKAIEESAAAQEKLKQIALAMQNLDVKSPEEIAPQNQNDQA
ncbi:hypothetical protein SOV_51330 [Sporomusa ovata DSM 2662]|uniref:Uncharacterized protein n=1 Tax=Sporomusa ovata TaxID=2378 RepID=A0A0U1L106_9FIRM|nr:hypothetical protein [Sporomusa ovata]EQB27506.1 hypothetical protein SOV_2c04020 [Sporomusa ovata DSM 2662]CQR73352.1 hypothetical protein SpAn4DRAFT_2584 [Sporomusa ovata]